MGTVRCECGCGAFVGSDSRGRQRRFVKGHWNRLRAKTAEQRFTLAIHWDGRGDHRKCWRWQRRLDRGGYGLFWTGERNEKGQPIKKLAHRWAYEHFVGPIPAGLHVLHTCDEPSCVNPAHLVVGTQADNMADCIVKGRRAKQLSAAHRAAIGRGLRLAWSEGRR